MVGRLTGKVVVITGAASGIGESAARLFAAEGALLVLTDIQVERGEKLAADLRSATFLRVDVTDENDVAAAVSMAVSRHGRLDCMINNAAMLGAVGSIRETTADDWHKTLALVLDSVFYGIKHAARIMVEQRSGSIISTASLAGLRCGLGAHAYTVAKHGVVAITGSSAQELAPHLVRVNAVAPGPTLTPGNALGTFGDKSRIDEAEQANAARLPMQKAILPEDLAAAMLYFASDDSRFVTGQTIAVDGGILLGDRGLFFHNAPAAYVA
jgi:NAD(P)-dependent dehydrogenase (short-subunit alcohol dehydrogenase family)